MARTNRDIQTRTTLKGRKYLMELLEYHRVRQGKTQTQAAKSVGVTVSAWNKWEVRGKLPSPEYLPKVARFCGLTTDVLLQRLVPDVAQFQAA
jgi:transcriptional regulator with XRE-family HTH domain